jgi:hypothetical protein
VALDVRDRNVVVVDDVYTTGATAWTFAVALQRAGARQTRLVALERCVAAGPLYALDPEPWDARVRRTSGSRRAAGHFQVLLVRQVKRRQKRDCSPFLRVTLADRSGVVPGVLWSAGDLEPGTPARVSGWVAEHARHGRQVTIESVDTPEPREVPGDELLDAPARSAEELAGELDAVVASITDPHLGALLDR